MTMSHRYPAPEFFEWFRENADQMMDRPWLVLGKGPSFARISSVNREEYHLLGLNHVVSRVPVTLAHAIDLDVILACEGMLEANARYVVMPLYPHVNNCAGTRKLFDYFEEIPVLARLAAAGRLLWYNAATTELTEQGYPVVPVKYFSAEAAVNLLAMAGVRCIRTLGIDGGATYSQQFSQLGTLLANGRRSFNIQFRQIAKAIMKHDLDYAPLGADSPIKVFVATTEAQMLAVKVLEYSIKKHASMRVEVQPLHACGITIPQPREQKNWPRTPFSFQRFIIPQACGFQGRAIYLDSDMQVFADIRELWEMDFDGHQLLSAKDAKVGDRKPQYSVMLLDCVHLDWNIADIVDALDGETLSYESLMYDMCVARSQAANIPAEWNSLESFKEKQTKLLHYTDMDTQPWIHSKHPLGYIWCRDLFEAIKEGFIDVAMLDEHIEKGWVRPSLRYQLDHNIEDPLLLPREARAMDDRYAPPFLGIHQHAARPWVSMRGSLLAVIRRLYALTPLPILLRKMRTLRERYE